MRLYATPLSHYSRKVRLLLDHYGVEYALLSPGDVAGSEAARFGGHPVMKVPVLEDDGTWLVESDHIAQYVVRKLDPADRYRVLASDPETLNLRAVMNAVMQEEVKLILAERTGIETAKLPFFEKARLAIENGLDWLEMRAGRFDARSPGYAEFHLVSLMDHLAHYGLLRREYPALRDIVKRISESEVVAHSSPKSSLERYGGQFPGAAASLTR